LLKLLVDPTFQGVVITRQPTASAWSDDSRHDLGKKS
jgi:hypothetical protein